MSTNFLKSVRPLKAAMYLGCTLVSAECALPLMVHSHGSGGGEPLEVGEFRAAPLLTFEAHAGLENNIEADPAHYGFDTLLGVVMDWGLENDGLISLELAAGSVLVQGEAHHFYGEIHEEEEEEEEHEYGTDFKRTDYRAFFKVKYAPNDRLSFFLDTQPYWVTRNQGEEKKGTKNELGAKTIYALGDGDVDFALGDKFSDLIDGTYLSLDHRRGWGQDGHSKGQYTDSRIGVGFNFDLVSVRVEGGPRFYSPGFNSNLSHRTDYAGELEVSRPIDEKSELFFHWQPTFTYKDGSSWKEGWQHHLGAGVTFRF